MKTFEDLDKVVDFHIRHRLPNRIFIFGDAAEIEEKTRWLREISSAGITLASYINHTGDRVLAHSIIKYRGYEFVFIDINNTE